jgi:hypothetical protein
MDISIMIHLDFEKRKKEEGKRQKITREDNRGNLQDYSPIQNINK